jgi:hypothetical protein
VVIKPQFMLACEFLPEGIAALVDDRGWACIHEKGKILIRPSVFDNGPDYLKASIISRFVFGSFSLEIT